MKKMRRMPGILLAALMLTAQLTAMPAAAETSPAPETETVVPNDEISTTGSAAETTTTEAVTTTTEAVSTTTETAEIERVPVLEAEVPDMYPGGKTTLTLRLKRNPGINALALTVQLPSVLKPETAGTGVNLKAGPALNVAAPEGGVTGAETYTIYNSAANTFSLVFAAYETAPAEDLLATLNLSVSADAPFDTPVTVKVLADQMDLAGEAEPESMSAEAVFTPYEPLVRAFPESLTLTEQDVPVQLALDPLPPAGSCAWSSSNSKVVSVNQKGEITALRSGVAYIIVVCETRSYTCKVESNIAREVTAESYTITEKGGQLAMAVSPVPHDTLVWDVSDDTVASIDENGVLTALANGKVTVTAMCDGIPFSALVTVNFPCRLNYTSYTAVGTGGAFKLELEDIAAFGVVTWSSSNPEVASVDDKGTVTFLAEGSADIIAEYGGRSYVCKTECVTYLRGDADLNGQVNAMDAMAVLICYNLEAVLEEPGNLSEQAKAAADVDGSGTVDTHDALLILRYTNLSMLGEDITWEDLIQPAGKS